MNKIPDEFYYMVCWDDGYDEKETESLEEARRIKKEHKGAVIYKKMYARIVK